jgi:phosphate transport system substrate-binding protein
MTLAAVVACLALPGPARAQSGAFTIQVDGSSTVFPLAENAASGFQQRAGGLIRVAVGESGTGGGFRKFCRGEIQIATASRPILAREMATCAAARVGFIEVPIAFDAVAVVVHPDNPVRELSVAQLRQMWEPAAAERITNWRQINPAFPNRRLTLYGPGTASGTFDYFTEAVMGKAKASRPDYVASEDDNVLVQGVGGDIGGLGYFGMAYYLQNRNRVRSLGIALQPGGPAYPPTVETVQQGQYRPLGRPIFIYVSALGLRRREVGDFVSYWLHNASQIASDRYFVPLPASAYEVGQRRVRMRLAGTAFAGRQDVGGTIDEAMSRPLVLTVE